MRFNRSNHFSKQCQNSWHTQCKEIWKYFWVCHEFWILLEKWLLCFLKKKLLIFEENPPRGHNKRIIKFSSIKTTKINVFSFQMSKIKLNLIAFHIYLLHFNNTTKKCDSKMLVKLSICRESRTKMSQLESLIF